MAFLFLPKSSNHFPPPSEWKQENQSSPRVFQGYVQFGSFFTSSPNIFLLQLTLNTYSYLFAGFLIVQPWFPLRDFSPAVSSLFQVPPTYWGIWLLARKLVWAFSGRCHGETLPFPYQSLYKASALVSKGNCIIVYKDYNIYIYMYKRTLAPLVSHDILQICGPNTATFILGFSLRSSNHYPISASADNSLWGKEEPWTHFFQSWINNWSFTLLALPSLIPTLKFIKMKETLWEVAEELLQDWENFYVCSVPVHGGKLNEERRSFLWF